jgi:hypothetical protein
LVPFARRLARAEVPFGLMAANCEEGTLGNFAALRDAPRLIKLYTERSLFTAARELYRADLRHKIEAADRRIGDARRRLARQVRLIEQVSDCGMGRSVAKALAHETARGLRLMRASRAILFAHLQTLRD